MFRTPVSLLAATAALLPAAATGQEGYRLDEVVISGGLTAVAEGGYARAHTVLTAEEIEARGIATVQDALRAVPGVSVSATGSTFTQVRIRGGEGNHTLILIDGIEATGGADEYILTGLETANIERIEVLRGPQSVYYGSNASAGVINIITRKGGPGLHYGGSVELGNGAAASAHVSQRGAQGGIALTLSARDDHGYDQSGNGGEKDGTNRKTIGLSGDWQIGEDLRLGTTLRRAKEKYDYDSTSWSATSAQEYVVDDPHKYSERDEFQGGIWAEYSMLGGRLTHRLDYQDTIYKQSSDGGPVTRGETRKLKYRGSFGIDGTVAEASHLLNVLAERQRDESSSAPENRREMTSVALEYRGFLDNGLDVQAGVRHDGNKVFEDFTSWNLGLSWHVPDQPFRLHASAGTGLVNPSYFELYANADYGSSVYLGNPNLKPEKNRGFDLGVEAQLPNGMGVVDVTYFNEKLRDEIESYLVRAEGGTSYYSYRNQAGESPREGVEVTARIKATDSLDVALNYTYLDARNPDGSVEVRRPRHELGLSATLAVLEGRSTVTADIRHVSGNWDTQYWTYDPASQSYDVGEIPAHTVVNLAAGYDLTENLRVTGRVVNLFDKEYSDVWGYASQGRTLYAGLTAKW
ncbi:TonB-dependent receptor plug domain-containing protein [Paracoccus versutus]